MTKIFRQIMIGLAVCMIFLPTRIHADATTGEMSVFPNVTVSPDGSNRAWTTDYGDRSTETLPLFYSFDMNAESTIRDLNAGEHYYRKAATGAVTVGKWEVRHSPGQCIHGEATENTFAGFTFGTSKCYRYYNNGWFAYCADCGEPVANMLIYGRKSTMEKITFVPANSIYMYMCPLCDNIEQGVVYQHYCKGISNNRYTINYRNNSPADSAVLGYMAPTMHLYNNSDTYNGQPAAIFGYTDKKLRKNSLTCVGYVFTGWNTKADGSGTAYSDGQAVLNLTSEEAGRVVLYAQWVKSENSLLVDAAGGTYNGAAVYEKVQKYGTTYKVNTSLLKPPVGYTVSFVTGNGATVADITTTKHFSNWEI